MRPHSTLVFARAPVPGEVKTRLIPALGAARAASLHEALLLETLGKACRVTGTSVQLWCAPDTGHPAFTRIAEVFGVDLVAQAGADLGERMADAMRRTLTRCPAAVLIGSDCPELTAADIDAAHAALEDGYDVVLGPAEDGGYVLVGMRVHAPQIFAGIEWGGSCVLSQTLERLASLRLRWHTLPVRRDVDRPEDLTWLRQVRPDLLTGTAPLAT